MKALGITSSAVLSLLLAVAAPAWAQEHEQEPKDRPAQQEEKKAQPEKNAKPEQRHAQQEEKTAKPEQRHAAQQEKSAKQARGGRIPDDRFKANFGQQHRFHVRRDDYDRDRRFQYGGYSFVFVDPWPSDWLYTDDVYVDYDNDMYYLYSPVHPGIRIVINIM
jgi:hypothetical protein